MGPHSDPLHEHEIVQPADNIDVLRVDQPFSQFGSIGGVGLKKQSEPSNSSKPPELRVKLVEA